MIYIKNQINIMIAERKTYGLFYMTLVPPLWLLCSGNEQMYL